MDNKEYRAWIEDQISWLEQQKKDAYLTEEEQKALKDLREALEGTYTKKS